MKKRSKHEHEGSIGNNILIPVPESLLLVNKCMPQYCVSPFLYPQHSSKYVR